MNDLLAVPQYDSFPILTRPEVSYSDLPLQKEALTVHERNYNRQYGDIYFLRLAMLKTHIQEVAKELWSDVCISGQTPHEVNRVLEIQQGQLCWVIGTIYKDMPLKPNVLEDLCKEHWLIAPPPRQKYIGAGSVDDKIMLEDESGRVNLVGQGIHAELLVTGCVVAVLGCETEAGDFEAVDICLPELPPQVLRTFKSDRKKYVAFVSGLDICGESYEKYETHLLFEYLSGELFGHIDGKCADICRFIIAGNSVQSSNLKEELSSRKAKKYGYDASSYNPKPTMTLDNMLAELCSTLTVDLMPGMNDPANVSLPQQPLHYSLFPKASKFHGSSFHTVTNPYWCEIEGVTFLGTSGQTLDDIYKYVPGDDRLEMMHRTLRWRHYAPTCPDTLCKCSQ